MSGNNNKIYVNSVEASDVLGLQSPDDNENDLSLQVESNQLPHDEKNLLDKFQDQAIEQGFDFSQSEDGCEVRDKETKTKICEYKKPGVANFAYPKGNDYLKTFFESNSGKAFSVNKCNSVEAAINLAQLAKKNKVSLTFNEDILKQLETNNSKIREELGKILEMSDGDLVHKTAHKRPGA